MDLRLVNPETRKKNCRRRIRSGRTSKRRRVSPSMFAETHPGVRTTSFNTTTPVRIGERDFDAVDFQSGGGDGSSEGGGFGGSATKPKSYSRSNSSKAKGSSSGGRMQNKSRTRIAIECKKFRAIVRKRQKMATKAATSFRENGAFSPRRRRC